MSKSIFPPGLPDGRRSCIPPLGPRFWAMLRRASWCRRSRHYYCLRPFSFLCLSRYFPGPCGGRKLQARSRISEGCSLGLQGQAVKCATSNANCDPFVLTSGATIPFRSQTLVLRFCCARHFFNPTNLTERGRLSGFSSVLPPNPFRQNPPRENNTRPPPKARWIALGGGGFFSAGGRPRGALRGGGVSFFWR